MTESPRRRRLLIALLLLPLVLVAGVLLMILFSRPPANLGVTDGRLAPCPDSPNCVSSQADAADATHYVEPLPLSGAPETAIAELQELLAASLPRTQSVAATDTYLHVVCTTRLMRFKDDVEFLVDREAGVIHVRSASRVGYSDLGANRRRVERIRELWVELWTER